MMVEIERRVAAAINEMAPSGGLTLIQLDPSACKSSCASTTVPEEQRAIAGVQVDGSQRYLVDDICRRTPCELHKPFGNIKMKVCIIHAFIISIIYAYEFEISGPTFTMMV
jgi:hypothetical protein